MDTRREIGRLLGRLEVASWRPAAHVAGIVIGAAGLALVPAYPGLGPAGVWALFILVVAAGLWVTEAIPAFAVAILVMGLEIAILGRPGGPFATGPDDWKIFIEPWGSPLVWLFFSGFVLAKAATASGLDRWFSVLVLRRFGDRPSRVLLGAMLVTCVFSMFTSNTATTAMMVAVLTPLLGDRQDPRFGRALLVGVAFAANIGGMGTIIGTPPNAIAAGQLADVAPIGFAGWMMVGIPVSLVLLVLAWVLLVRRYPSRGRVDLSVLGAADQGGAMPRWQRLVVVGGFSVTVALWVTEPVHGIATPVVAFVPVVLFTLTGVLGSQDIRTLQWDVLLLLAGGLSLGVAVSETGLARWMVEALPLQAQRPVVVAAILATATACLSNFMSNTAAANIVVPMGLALGVGHEALVVVPIALAASVAMCLPVSTPPNAIAFSTGKVEGRDFFTGGLIVGGVGIVLAVAWSWLVLA